LQLDNKDKNIKIKNIKVKNKLLNLQDDIKKLKYTKILLERFTNEMISRYCISFYLHIILGIKNNDFNYMVI